MVITFNKICLVLTYNADSPTARRGKTGWQCAIVETLRATSLRDGRNGSAAAPERPNNKKNDAHVLFELSLRNLNKSNRFFLPSFIPCRGLRIIDFRPCSDFLSFPIPSQSVRTAGLGSKCGHYCQFNKDIIEKRPISSEVNRPFLCQCGDAIIASLQLGISYN